MKRLALLALLLAAPVAAQERASLMLVRQPPATNVTKDEEYTAWNLIQGICKTWGIEYSIVNWQATDSSLFRHGIEKASDNPTPTSATTFKTHEGVVHVAWTKGRYGKADATTLGARWPTVETAFLAYSPSGIQDAATCSTGIRSISGHGSEMEFGLVYSVSGPYGWRSPDAIRAGFGDHVAASNRTGGAYGSGGAGRGIWRPLIGTASDATGDTANVGETTTLGDFARDDDPDSVIAWMRRPTTSAGAPTGAPIYFAMLGAADGPRIDPTLYVLAKMDSSIYARTGKRLITKIPKMGLVTERWMASSAPNLSSTADSLTNSAPFCPVNASCDSANIKAALDSLGALDVPITFVLEIDSLDTSAFQWQEAAIRNRVPKYHMAWTSYAGTIALGSPGLAGAGRFMDVWGHTRARQLIPDNYAGNLNPTDFTLADCPGADSSIVCQALRADSILTARYPGRVDHLVHAAYDDWTPRQIDRAGNNRLDSLAAVVHIANGVGWRTNADRSPTSGAGRIRGGPPNGYTVGKSEWPAYSNADRSSTKLATLYTVPSRGSYLNNGTPDFNSFADHDLGSEHYWGFWTGEWYFDDALRAIYVHDFQVRPLVFKFNANALGAQGGAGGSVIRAGLWHAMWLVRRSQALNHAAGRTVIDFVPCDQVVGQ